MFYNRIYYTSKSIFSRLKNPRYAVRKINTIFDESNYNSGGGNNNNSNEPNVLAAIISLSCVYLVNKRNV